MQNSSNLQYHYKTQNPSLTSSQFQFIADLFKTPRTSRNQVTAIQTQNRQTQKEILDNSQIVRSIVSPKPLSKQSDLRGKSNSLGIFQTVSKSHYYTKDAFWAFKKQNKNQQTKDDTIYIQHIEHSYYALKSTIYVKKFLSTIKIQNIKINGLNPNQKTIAIDLDETLVRSNRKFNLQELQFKVRPFTKEFLNSLSPHFNLIIFTAAEQKYAELMISAIDPERKIFKTALFRQHCYLFNKQMFIKDLRILDIDLSNVLIIDNTTSCFLSNIDNGVPIIPFTDNKQDIELKGLLDFLIKEIYTAKDVRSVISQKFKFRQFPLYKSPEQAVNFLYATG